MPSRPSVLRSPLAALGLVSACALGCNIENEGIDPPPGRLNFPMVLSLPSAIEGAPPRHLFVANSNFNLAYNAGSIQSFDLAAINAALPETCISDGGCAPLDPAAFLVSEVFVPPFATGMELGHNGQRLYAIVRSEASLIMVEVGADGLLSCGGVPGEPHRCDESRVRGRDSSENERQLVLPNDPTGLAVGRLDSLDPAFPADAGDYVVVSHRGGAASLFLETPGQVDGPVLVHVLEGLIEGLAGVTRAPDGTFLFPSDRTNDVSQLGVAIDQGNPQRSFLFDSGALRILGVDFGRPGSPDIRAVKFRPEQPDRAYLLARRPEAMLFVDYASRFSGGLDIGTVVPLGVGPSRFTFATVAGRELLLASCFDSRDIYIIDLELERLLAVIRGFSGPFDLVVDPVRQRVYVADFRASVVQVVSLAPMVRCLDGMRTMSEECSPRVLGSLGVPRPVEELR